MVQVLLENIQKTYLGADDPEIRKRPALDEVNLEIAAGETLSVVGPSGCGKSTLLKIVAGLEFPEKGRVLYNGYDVTRVEPQQRGVGMVFQDYALYPAMKSQGNLQYYFEIRHRTQEQMEQRVHEVADMMGVGFEMLLGQMPTTLSGGEQQRVAIARCIVREPTVFLMDEPISNLDAKLRERTRVEIKKMLRAFGISTVYVTHDQQEAIFMGDRIAVLREGKLEQVGTFDDLHKPVNFGDVHGAPQMSILQGEIAGNTLSLGPTLRLDIPDAVAGTLPQGAVRIGVRPEGWILQAPPSDGVPVAVTMVERIPTQQAAFIRGRLAKTSVTVLGPLNFPNMIRFTPDWEQLRVRSDEKLRCMC
jgi:ABC-type sugar transport system ATPase subunit